MMIKYLINLILLLSSLTSFSADPKCLSSALREVLGSEYTQSVREIEYQQFPPHPRQDLAVIRDARTQRQRAALQNFENSVDMNDQIYSLMNRAHLAAQGPEKNRIINELVNTIASQQNITRNQARDLVLGSAGSDGIRRGGLSSADTMILGSGYPVAANFNDFLRNYDFGQLLGRFSSRIRGSGHRVLDKKGVIDGIRLKKGDVFYIDTLHWDHIEVFDKDGNVQFVFNLDGSYNARKTKLARDEGRTISRR